MADLFYVHDELGRIIQASKVFDTPKGYTKQLRSGGHRFVQGVGSQLVHPEEWHVVRKVLAERPTMDVSVSKLFIKAGGTDTVVLRGAPKDVRYRVEHNLPGIGVVTPYEGTLPDGELEIGMDMPCIFTVKLGDLFPYRDFSVTIEAMA